MYPSKNLIILFPSSLDSSKILTKSSRCRPKVVSWTVSQGSSIRCSLVLSTRIQVPRYCMKWVPTLGWKS